MTVYVLLIEDCGMKPKKCGTRNIFFYFTVNGTVRKMLQEKGPKSIIRHVDYLKKLFPDDDFSMF